LEWVLLENLRDFAQSWLSPFSHPKIREPWRQIPPHLGWSVWKERNNRIFREKARSANEVFHSFNRLVSENTSSNTLHVAEKPPTLVEVLIVKNWRLIADMTKIDNSKKMARQDTLWRPPPKDWIKLNFDGAEKKNTRLASGGGISGIVRVCSLLLMQGASISILLMWRRDWPCCGGSKLLTLWEWTNCKWKEIRKSSLRWLLAGLTAAGS